MQREEVLQYRNLRNNKYQYFIYQEADNKKYGTVRTNNAYLEALNPAINFVKSNLKISNYLKNTLAHFFKLLNSVYQCLIKGTRMFCTRFKNIKKKPKKCWIFALMKLYFKVQRDIIPTAGQLIHKQNIMYNLLVIIIAKTLF